MARSTQHEWFSFRRAFSRRASQQRSTKRQPLRRRLCFEPLEDRRLLALVTVTTLNDTVDLGDGVTSLREAIFATNLVGGADTIEFAASLTSGGPATITLTQGELPISDDLTINGPGANLLTIDASGNDPTPDVNNGDGSRVFNIDDGNSVDLLDVSISGLTLTGGDTSGAGGAILAQETLILTASTISGNNSAGGNGGGIHARVGNVTVTASTISGNSALNGGGIRASVGDVTVTSSTISGNSAYHGGLCPYACPYGGSGGGISAGGDVTVTDSTISGNSAQYGGGGGIIASYVTVTSSTISGNSTGYGSGGGVYAGGVTVTSSTISGNSAGYGGGGIFSSNAGNLTVTLSTISGNSAGERGGGIFAYFNATVTSSTISGNSADLIGGGIYIFDGLLQVGDSTISGNFADRDGGGIHISHGLLQVAHSTIADNRADADGNLVGQGGGIAAGILTTVQLNHAIVADNRQGSVNNEVFNVASVQANHSLVETTAGVTLVGSGNTTGLDPLLGPLADYGGPTFTHALLAGSPAIDAGDPNFNPADPDGNPMSDDAVPYDQRGAPFNRVFDGDSNGVARIDIGAYESQPHGIPGDYNLDGGVNASDYVMWRKFLSTSVAPPFTGADGDGDSAVDPGDYDVWRGHFGQTLPPPGAGSGAGEASSVEIQELRADAPAVRNFAADYIGESVVQIPMETNSAPAKTVAAPAPAASFTALETRPPGHDSSSRSRRTIHRYQVAESGGDNLPLLLAIDRVGRSPRQDSIVNDDSWDDAHRSDDDEAWNEVEEPLAVALAEWQ